jgi:hypothetical protein
LNWRANFRIRAGFAISSVDAGIRHHGRARSGALREQAGIREQGRNGTVFQTAGPAGGIDRQVFRRCSPS